MTRYGTTALGRECAAVTAAGAGVRNHALNAAALNLGQLVAGGQLAEQEARARLLAAAAAAGLDHHEALRTIASGFQAGAQRPRTASHEGTHQRPRREPEAPARPPRSELAALWDAGMPPGLTTVGPWRAYIDAAHFIIGRGYNPATLAELDLCRVLPDSDGYDLPRWFPGRWARTWALAMMAYEPDGTPGSLQARAVVPVPEGSPKIRWPWRCSSKRLLFADAAGRRLLCGQRSPARVLVVEGLTDTLRAAVWAARRAEELRDHLAVLGVAAGGAPALADIRWPAGSCVIVATDLDAAGEKYARTIRAAVPNHVPVQRLRWRHRDDHDAT